MTMRPARLFRLLLLTLTAACAACALQATAPSQLASEADKPLAGPAEAPRWPMHGVPRLTIGQDGHPYLLWMAAESGQSWDILVSRSEDFGVRFSPPMKLRGGKGTNAGGHQIATGPNGQVYVVWREWDPKRKDPQVWFVRSQNQGVHWDAPVRLFDASSNVGFPLLLTDRDGGIFIGSLVGAKSHRVLEVATSHDYGATFSLTPTRLTAAFPTSEYGITNPSMVSDGEGRLYVVWEEMISRSDTKVYMRRSLDRGKTWSDPVLVSTPEESQGRAYFPQVVTSSNGQVSVAWVEDEFKADAAAQPGELMKPDRFVAINRSLDSAQTWLPQPIRLNLVDQDPLFSATPHLSRDRRGHVYATWIEGDHSRPKRLLFAHSSDAGMSWSDPKVRLEQTSPFGGRPAHPMMRSDDAGHIWIVWQEISPERKQWQLLVNRSNDGGVTWSARATPLVSATSRGGGYRTVSFESDAHGRLYVAWEGGPEDAQALYLNRSIDFGETWLSREVEIGRR